MILFERRTSSCEVRRKPAEGGFLETKRRGVGDQPLSVAAEMSNESGVLTIGLSGLEVIGDLE